MITFARFICVWLVALAACEGKQVVAPNKAVHDDLGSFRAATFNIQVGIGAAWEGRRPRVLATIANNGFEIFGTQEGLPGQLSYLKSGLVGFDYIGRDRDGNGTGEHCAIFYKTDVFQLLDSGTFWLSATPDVVSKGWDADLNRVCTWGAFKHIHSGREFYVFNAHFDHIGSLARANSTTLILAKLLEIAGNTAPVIFLGDLNFDQFHANYSVIDASGSVKDAIFLATTIYAPHGTFHGYSPPPYSNRIDHIFVRETSFNVSNYQLVNGQIDGAYPSDHFPIYVDLSFN